MHSYRGDPVGGIGPRNGEWFSIHRDVGDFERSHARYVNGRSLNLHRVADGGGKREPWCVKCGNLAVDAGRPRCDFVGDGGERVEIATVRAQGGVAFNRFLHFDGVRRRAFRDFNDLAPEFAGNPRPL